MCHVYQISFPPLSIFDSYVSLAQFIFIPYAKYQISNLSNLAVASWDFSCFLFPGLLVAYHRVGSRVNPSLGGTSLLGLFCFASFWLAILNTKDQSLGTWHQPSRFHLLYWPLPIVRRPKPCTSCLSTLYACNTCLGLVGLVACGKRWPIFGCHNLVTFVMQAVCRD